MNEHDDEPVRGLPGHPPEGESILWQGAPNARSLSLRGFHVRGLALYFAAIWAYSIASTVASGSMDIRLLLAPPVLGGVAVGLIAGFAALVARTTLYTVTNRRIAIRFGVALSMTVNIPFRQIEGAGFRQAPDGTGDLVLSLVPGTKIAYLAMWPHVRPWRLKSPEPMLRALRDAPEVARVLSRALAASAGTPVRGMIASPGHEMEPAARPVAA